MKYVLGVVSFVLLGCAAPGFSTVTVTSPLSGAQVSSPFALKATASPCGSQSISAMGYSLDNSTNTTIVQAASVSASVGATLGSHVLHVKSWGNAGAVCVTDVPISVVSTPMASTTSSAITVYGIQKQDFYWQGMQDAATGSGIASGTMSMVSSPTITGFTRKFVTNFRNAAGERFWTSIGKDTSAHNFVYDVRVFVDSTADEIANIEMDMNQVIANGETIIYGVQCDGYSNTWDYTTNAGSPTNPIDQWLHSTIPCNPRSWAKNVWHHIQIAYSRDDQGNVTYKYITFDGVQKNLNETVPSAFALGWSSTLLTNFQVDGLGGYGTANVYVDKLTISRW